MLVSSSVRGGAPMQMMARRRVGHRGAPPHAPVPTAYLPFSLALVGDPKNRGSRARAPPNDGQRTTTVAGTTAS